MPLTEISRITRAQVSWNRNKVDSVYFQLEGGQLVRVDLANGYPAEGSASRATLEIMQTLYANTLMDNEGNHIVPILAGFPFGDNIDDLEKHGFYNPLKSGSYEKYLKNRLAEGDQLLLVARETRPNGQIIHKSKIGSVPQLFTPGSVTRDVPLTGWDANFLSNTRYILVYDPRPFASESEVYNYDPIKGMGSFFLNHKYEGDDIPLDFDFTTANFGGNRRYRETFDEDRGPIEFRVDSIVYVTGEGSVQYVAIDFIVTSALTEPITQEITSFFHASLFPVLTAEGDTIAPTQGSQEVPQHASRLCLPGADLFYTDWLYMSTSEGNRGISSARTRIMPFNQLPTFNNTSDRQVPKDPSVGVIHIHEGSSGDLVIPYAWNLAFPGETAQFVVFNKRGSAITVKALGNANTTSMLCHVQNDEAVTFYVSNNMGEAGEIRAHLRDRLFIADKHETGNIRWLQGGTVFDSGNKAVIPIHDFFLDEGAFERDGTATDPTTDLYGPHAVKLRHAGTAEITMDIALRIAAGVDPGLSLPRGWDVALWFRRGTTNYIYAPPEQAVFSGADATTSISFSRHLNAEAGDVLALVFDKNGGDLANDQIEITALDWKVKLHTNVYHTY